MNFTIKDPGLRFPRARARRARTTGIVVHHFAGNLTPQRVHDLHIGRGWNGVGYNFMVDFDGTIWLGRGMEFSGAHTEGHNSATVGIGCNGDFHTGRRTMPDAQFNALLWLVQHIMGVYGNIPIHGHRDLGATACPGQHFPLQELRRLQFRGQTAAPEPRPENILEGLNMTRQELTELIRQEIRAAMKNVGTTPNELMQNEFEQAVVAGITDGSRPRDAASRLEVALMVHRAMREG